MTRLRAGRKVLRTLYEQAGDEPSDDDRLVGLASVRARTLTGGDQSC